MVRETPMVWNDQITMDAALAGVLGLAANLGLGGGSGEPGQKYTMEYKYGRLELSSEVSSFEPPSRYPVPLRKTYSFDLRSAEIRPRGFSLWKRLHE